MICLFEDALASNFSPVADTRHVAHLRVGAMNMRERALRATGETRFVLHGRRYILNYYRETGLAVDRPAETTLFINARLPLTRGIVARLPSDEEWIATAGGAVMAARLREPTIARLDWGADALEFGQLGDVEHHEIEMEGVRAYEYLWDMIADNGEMIARDFDEMDRTGAAVIFSGAHLLNHERIIIGGGSVLKPGVVIDATHGPVIIGSDVQVMANAVIEGPCFIGDHSVIKIGAKIYGQSAIGRWCKVGGEVENSIILGYSNKQHDGFLGHSYLGRWVNLGADTNTSDLKNNYGMIRVTIGGREIGTGRMFLGALIGDHARTGINTMLNTGSVIGVGANVFGGGFPSKSIPPFAWGGFGGEERYRLDDALAVAARVMARRRVEFTTADETLLRYLYGRAE